jgi:mRNA-degrading endonuclease HigB of HigAB toxin-antitoxin module
MPRIEWLRLPSVREHLRDRVRTRAIDAKDLVALRAWINTEPNLAEGTWCLHEVRREYPSADQVDGVLIFDVRGEHYRLIATANYARQR